MADVEIALNRFGLGWKAGEAPPVNPRRWLVDQIGRYDPAPAAIAALPRTPEQIGKLAAIAHGVLERNADGRPPVAARSQQSAHPAPGGEGVDVATARDAEERCVEKCSVWVGGQQRIA